MISYEDFKRVFQSPEDGDMESKTVGSVGASTIESVQPKPIPELVDMIRVSHMMFSQQIYYFFIYFFAINTAYWTRRSCQYHRRTSSELQSQGKYCRYGQCFHSTYHYFFS
jgi:hypothetical protein